MLGQERCEKRRPSSSAAHVSFEMDVLRATFDSFVFAHSTSCSYTSLQVIIYMPMMPEAAFAMLACARLGAVHSVVFGGFAGLLGAHACPH